MRTEYESPSLDNANEAYFDEIERGERNGFDERLLHAPVSVLRRRVPIVFREDHNVTDAVRAMQRDHRGCVLISEDGTRESQLVGIFTERDVLLRIMDKGRVPVTIQLGEVMVREPECLPCNAPVAWVLNKMSVGGFRHVPVVDDSGRPAFVVSVRDVVEFLVESFPEEILNLPPDFGLKRYQTRDGA